VVDQEGREYITPEIERRQYRRVQLITQVRCETLSCDALLLTRDVSVGGLFIKSVRPLPANSEVSLTFNLKPSEPAITCRGRVVYAVVGLGMGIQFSDLTEEARQVLQRFVDESV